MDRVVRAEVSLAEIVLGLDGLEPLTAVSITLAYDLGNFRMHS